MTCFAMICRSIPGGDSNCLYSYPGTQVSRKDVVLVAADKDGGAHVDSALTPEYERLIESGDLEVIS